MCSIVYSEKMGIPADVFDGKIHGNVSTKMASYIKHKAMPVIVTVSKSAIGTKISCAGSNRKLGVIRTAKALISLHICSLT